MLQKDTELLAAVIGHSWQEQSSPSLSNSVHDGKYGHGRHFCVPVWLHYYLESASWWTLQRHSSRPRKVRGSDQSTIKQRTRRGPVSSSHVALFTFTQVYHSSFVAITRNDDTHPGRECWFSFFLFLAFDSTLTPWLRLTIEMVYIDIIDGRPLRFWVISHGGHRTMVRSFKNWKCSFTHVIWVVKNADVVPEEIESWTLAFCLSNCRKGNDILMREHVRLFHCARLVRQHVILLFSLCPPYCGSCGLFWIWKMKNPRLST